MNIYLVETSLHWNYDCAEAFVVQANSGVAAKGLTLGSWGDHEGANLVESLTATKLGVVTADLPQVEMVVLRSFNAG